MSPIEHAPTETNGSIAAPETNDRFVVHTCTQALFFSLGTAAKLLDLPSNRLHFIGGTVGGGFGGKVNSLTEPLSILGAMLTGRPVRYVLNREEEMLYGCPRGAERHFIKDGVMRDGRIVARKVSELLRRRRLYAPLQLRRGEVHRPHPRALHHCQRACRCVLRLHQPHAGHRHARLRHHRRRLRAGSADGQAGPQGRHGPHGVPHPQRLPRRRHQGAPARGPQLRADRVRAGGGRKGGLADPRRVPADVLAHRRWRRARRHPGHRHRRGRAHRCWSARYGQAEPTSDAISTTRAAPRGRTAARSACPEASSLAAATPPPHRLRPKSRPSLPLHSTAPHASPACSARAGGEPWPSIADAAWHRSTTPSA